MVITRSNMLKFYIVICSFFMLITQSLANGPNRSVFDKFHQSDYKVKYERTEVVSYKESVIKQFKMVTYKYNRTIAVTNITFELEIDVGHELEVITQTYKFMSNEYRYFPIRLQVNLCFAISRNLLGVGKLTKCGNFTGCPFRKHKILHMCNWTPDESNCPPLMPEGRYMIEFQMLYRSVEVAVFRGYSEAYRPFIF